MHNSVEKIKEIMKPYFENQEEIENNKEDKKSVIIKRNQVKLKLDRLKEDSQKEIEQYISDYVNSNSNFYAGYGAVVKKDLEKAYKDRQDSLEKQLNELNKKIELFDLKDNVVRDLLSEQNTLIVDLQEKNVEFNNIMLELSNFKYEYSEHHLITNGDEWKKIYKKSKDIADEISDLKSALNMINEYLNLLGINNKKELIANADENVINEQLVDEPTIEDSKTVEEELVEEPVVEDSEIEEEENVVEDTKSEEEPVQPEIRDIYSHISDDIIDSDDPVKVSYSSDDYKFIVDNYSELLKLVYNDVIEEAVNMRSIKLNSSKTNLESSERYFSVKKDKDSMYKVDGEVDLTKDEPIKLPNGEYINLKDFTGALKAYYTRNKAKTFVVNSINKELTLSTVEIYKIKSKLKRCSTIKLVKDKKIGQLDVRRIYGKEKAQEYLEESKSMESEIGTIALDNFPEGEYVYRNELIFNLKKLFTEKQVGWLRKMSDKIRVAITEKEEEISEVDSIDDEKKEYVNLSDIVEKNKRR